MRCPACLSKRAKSTFLVKNVQYIQCKACETIYASQPLTNTITHNDKPERRNSDEQHQVRLQRVIDALGQPPQMALDFGCGNGELVAFLLKTGIPAIGIDRGPHDDVPDETIDTMFMVEVIEHLAYPKYTLMWASCVLAPGGLLYIETTFADRIKDPQEDPYIDPEIGHVTILSLEGLGACLPTNLMLDQVVNDNVIILRKTSACE